jgi:hypothetical protein
MMTDAYVAYINLFLSKRRARICHIGKEIQIPVPTAVKNSVLSLAVGQTQTRTS